MRRRAVWLGAAAAAGLAAGTATALHFAGDGAAAPEADGADLWSLAFETVDGPSVRLASLRGKPLLLNFWATWCAPCVVELPLLDAFLARHAGAGWQILALAADSPEAVRSFVAARSLRLPIALAGETGLALSRQLGNSAGALPFTALFDRAGRLEARHLGVLSASILDRWSSETR